MIQKVKALAVQLHEVKIELMETYQVIIKDNLKSYFSSGCPSEVILLIMSRGFDSTWDQAVKELKGISSGRPMAKQLFDIYRDTKFSDNPDVYCMIIWEEDSYGAQNAVATFIR